MTCAGQAWRRRSTHASARQFHYDLIGFLQALRHGHEKMARDVGILVDNLFNFVAGKPLYRRTPLGDDRRGTLFTGYRCHFPKIFAWFGQLGNFFTAFNNR